MPPKATKPKPSGAKKPAAKKPAPTKAATAAAPAAPVEEPKAEASGAFPGRVISLKELSSVVLEDVDGKVKESGKWPLIIDTTGQAATFLKYQNCNCLNAMEPKDMYTETIRLGLIGALRFGKPIVIDMMEVDMFQAVSDKMEELLPGLLTMLMDKSIIEDENFMKLVKEVDGETYGVHNFNPMYLSNFKVLFVTQQVLPPEKLVKLTYPVRIE